jgi:hypothetical protein
MLDVVNAPRRPNTLVDEITMKTGDFWHEWATKQIQGIGWPFMAEVRLTDFLPEGWAGRADWVIYDPEAGGFVLGDLKTIKGEGLTWINRAGAKEDHLWQVSAYWHALYDMGLPMVKGFFVLYWPKNAVAGIEVAPSIQDCAIIERELIHARMQQRWEAVAAYKESLWPMAEDDPRWKADGIATASVGDDLTKHAGFYVTDKLAPPIERLQKVMWNAKQKAFDVKLVPHWSTAYCPFEDALCDCSTQGTTKIGSFGLDGGYGYKARNLDIATTSEIVHVIVADRYPDDYGGRRFDICYHHRGEAAHVDPFDHVKSGACWTGKEALKAGVPAIWHIINN